MTPTLRPSDSVSIECVHIGKERQPVLIIDNFLESPESLVETACQLTFTPETKLYPGIRCSAPPAYTDCMEANLPPLLEHYFGTQPGDINRAESCFSLVTTPPDQLKLAQKLPHFDSKNPRELASIYFLCNRTNENYGGTAFYRHRSSGLEYIDQPRFAKFASNLQTELTNTPLANEYICESNALFEQIAYFPAKFNRLLIYRTTSLHSGKISSDFNFDTNPRTARLSINTFLVN